MKITCVLIDDDIDDQEIFLYAMRDINPEIICQFYNDGDVAVRAMQDQQDFVPDCFFIDLNMPRMDGKTCLTQLKAMDRLKQVPVAIYTTSDDPRDKIAAQEAGADFYIIKEASLDELKPRLEKFLTTFLSITK